jgi:hypothetical protein
MTATVGGGMVSGVEEFKDSVDRFGEGKVDISRQAMH